MNHTPRDTLLNASDAYSNAQWDVENALEKLFGEDSVLGISWDSCDSSLEIYVWNKGADLCPTHEQVASVLALGFIQFWINYQDGTERHFSKSSIGERHACTHNRWDAYNRGHLEQRKLEREIARLRASNELLSEALRGMVANHGSGKVFAYENPTLTKALAALASIRTDVTAAK